MKKLLSIAILFVFLFLLGGYFIAWQVMMNENRSFMAESLKNGSLPKKTILIQLSKQQAKMLLDGREITWNNHRYDIVKIEYSGDKVLVSAINDDMEDQLVSALDAYQQMSEKTPIRSHSAINLLNDFFKEYTGASILIPAPGSQIVFLQTAPAENTGFLLKGHLGITTPPPKTEI